MRDYITLRALRIGIGIAAFFALLVLVFHGEFSMRDVFVLAVVGVALLLIIFSPSHQSPQERTKRHFRWRLFLLGGIALALFVAAFIVVFLAA